METPQMIESLSESIKAAHERRIALKTGISERAAIRGLGNTAPQPPILGLPDKK